MPGRVLATGVFVAKDFYDLLGIPPTASPEEIKAAYRRRAMDHHPDRTHDRQTLDRKLSDHQIRMLNEAYSVLSKPPRRELYDEARKSGISFDELEAARRPESDAEREAREAAEEHFKAASAAAVLRTVEAIRKLDPAVNWRDDPARDPYFDAALIGTRGPAFFRVTMKLFESLGPPDLPGISQYAEAVMAQVQPSLIRQQHAYLLVARGIPDRRAVYGAVDAFNRAAWHQARPRAPRAFIAFGAVQDDVVVAPSVSEPEPALTRLKLGLAPFFQF